MSLDEIEKTNDSTPGFCLRSPEPMEMLNELLKETVRQKATDLHLGAGKIPYLRIHGEMVALVNCFVLEEETVRRMIYSCMTDEQITRFNEDLDIDFSYSLPGHARFRVNALFEKNALGAVFRSIPEKPLSLDELGVPGAMKELCMKKQGLVLVTGRTGHGKTSTLAAALQYINENRKIHIITIEDPIEFSFHDKKSYIRQREVGVHTKSFAAGLRHALRQDPDAIIVGEMRDLETIAIALTAAETGHLVFSTLHTFGAVETINRIIDPFPPEQQQQIRMQLSSTLEAIFAQCLIPMVKGQGVVLGCEIMLAISAVRNIIREGRTHQLRQIIESHTESGMISMERSLLALYEKNLISYDDALTHAIDQGSLRDLLMYKGISPE